MSGCGGNWYVEWWGQAREQMKGEFVKKVPPHIMSFFFQRIFTVKRSENKLITGFTTPASVCLSIPVVNSLEG
jgi:hypothetical protein